MAHISITKLSSKGQIVIPQDMREGMKEGDKLIIIKDEGKLILKKAEDFDKNIEEDLEFARRTEEAWKDIDEGRFEEYELEEFLEKF
jgi:AbrB family looped-hinge helix DNA binding protein